MCYSCEKSISRKNPVLPIEKLPSIPRNADDYVTTPDYPIYVLLSVKSSLTVANNI